MTKRSTPQECFYCGALCSDGGLQWDHFPIPKSANGRDLVPACLACHDMKDRFALKNWPTDFAFAIGKDWPLLSREVRILLAKVMRQWYVSKLDVEVQRNIPFGFSLAADGVHLVENSEEQPILARVRELRRDGLSLRAIRNLLQVEHARREAQP